MHVAGLGGLKQRFERARRDSPLLDHVVRTVQHYGAVNGSQQSAGVTYFGFLSVFPVLLLAFTAVGVIAHVYPGARDTLISAITQVLPGLVGRGEHQLSLDDIESAAATAGLVGLLGVLYAGLGWLSALRTALIAVFQEPKGEQPNFVMGKLRDLSGLVVLGGVLLVGVALSGLITHFSGQVLDWLGLGRGLDWLLAVIAVVAGLAAGTLMFFLMFVLLARPQLPRTVLWQGALLAAVGFEALKQLSAVLLSSTAGQPAFQAFGIALILLVWINYFSQVTLYAAAWSYTSPAGVEAREARVAEAVQAGAAARAAGSPAQASDVSQVPPTRARSQAAPFALGAGAMLAAVQLLKRKKAR